jgi:hypothetical protein
LVHYCSSLWSPVADVNKVDCGNSLDDQIILSKCSCFVKAANINFSRIGDSEWFCTENRLFDHRDYRIIDRERKLHGEIWWHNICYNHYTSEHDFVATTIWVFEALLHDVITRKQGEKEEDQQVIVNFRALD